ncbi:MAG: MarR family winged helix-turn-helix transcriptional regulator [Bryobacteraceae bacterium]
MRTELQTPGPPSALPCLCANLRRASRIVTQLYEEALRPLGLRATQFTVLQALSLAGEVNQSLLGQILAMDSTTLTRTLEIMKRRGWIVQRRGEDRREWRIGLSQPGRDQLKRALPRWRSVQHRVHSQLGNELWEHLFNVTGQIVRALTGLSNPKGEKS